MYRLSPRPERYRSRSYLNDVRGRPCLQCGLPGEAHHLTFMQPRAMGMKVGDQYTVPLCHACHMDLHQNGLNEKTWWAVRGIRPQIWAENNYQKWLRKTREMEREIEADASMDEEDKDDLLYRDK